MNYRTPNCVSAGLPARSLRGRLSFRVIRRIVSYPSTLNSQLSTRRAFPAARQLPTYAPPRGFRVTGADRACLPNLLTAFNLRNGSRPVPPCQFGQDWHT